MIKSARPIAIALLLSVISLCFGNCPAYSQEIPLSPEQQLALKAVNIPVAVPTYIPDGFSLSQIELTFCPGSTNQILGCDSLSYELIYRNSENICLIISAVSGGLGGPDSEFYYPIQTDLFGEVLIGFGEIPGDGQMATPEQLQLPQSELYSFPARSRLTQPAYYSVNVEEERYFCGQNTAISPLDVEQILKSFIWLE
jgi:hypothetical protein